MFRKKRGQRQRGPASSRGGEGRGWLPKAVVTRLRRRSSSSTSSNSTNSKSPAPSNNINAASPCSVVLSPTTYSVKFGSEAASSSSSFEQSSKGDDSWTNVTSDAWEIVSPKPPQQEPSVVKMDQIGSCISDIEENEKDFVSVSSPSPTSRGNDSGSSTESESNTEAAAQATGVNDGNDSWTNATDNDDSKDVIVVPTSQELSVAAADKGSSTGNKNKNTMTIIPPANNSTDDEFCARLSAERKAWAPESNEEHSAIPCTQQLKEAALEKLTNESDDSGSSLTVRDTSASEMIEEGNTIFTHAAQQMGLPKDAPKLQQSCSSGSDNGTSSFNRYVAVSKTLLSKQSEKPLIVAESNETRQNYKNDDKEGATSAGLVICENVSIPDSPPFVATAALSNVVDKDEKHVPATATTTSDILEIGQRVCIQSNADKGRVGTIVGLAKKGTYSVQLDGIDARVVDKRATSLKVVSSPAQPSDSMADKGNVARSDPVLAMNEAFKLGQRVVITKTNLAGRAGVVSKKIDKITYKIQLDDGGTTNKRSTSLGAVLTESNPSKTNEKVTSITARETRARLAVGMPVRIVSGTNKGATGLIVGWKGMQTYSVEIAGVGIVDKRMVSVRAL